MARYMGVDIGSVTTKGVITGNGKTETSLIIPSGSNYRAAAARLKEELLEKAGLTAERLGVSDITAWELAASIVVLVLSIIGGLFLAIRVFRTYLLMYGKRPNLGEIIQNLRSG